jgi:hypothetical protein
MVHSTAKKEVRKEVGKESQFDLGLTGVARAEKESEDGEKASSPEAQAASGRGRRSQW